MSKALQFRGCPLDADIGDCIKVTFTSVHLVFWFFFLLFRVHFSFTQLLIYRERSYNGAASIIEPLKQRIFFFPPHSSVNKKAYLPKLYDSLLSIRNIKMQTGACICIRICNRKWNRIANSCFIAKLHNLSLNSSVVLKTDYSFI